MSRATDGILAVIALAAFVGGLLVADAPLSVSFLAAGVLGTLAFEAVAFGHAETVQRYWSRPIIQAGTFAGALALAGVGIVVAPSPLLSAGIGALAAYLVVLSVVVVRTVHHRSA